MEHDPELTRALEAALVMQPEQHPIRLHLAHLLLSNRQFAAALGHCQVVLNDEPGNDQALELADAARAGLGLPTETPSPPSAPSRPIPTTEPDVQAESSRPGAEHDSDTGISDDLLAELVRPDVTLDDIAGLDDVKAQIRAAFLDPLQHEELARAYGTHAGGSLLLFGPPGCGKTRLARALAGEMGIYFLSIELHDVLDMWLGSSERNLHAAFDTAREMAPSVLFIDEIDAIGHRRSNLRNAIAARGSVTQLLTELDGVRNDNRSVYILAATNEPWDVDPALRRPGRFDRSILVLPPDESARAAILAINLRDRLVGDLDLSRIARATPLFSGADLRLTCRTAAQHAAQRAIRSGQTLPITTADLEDAASQIHPTATIEWLRRAHAYAQVSDNPTDFTGLTELVRKHRL